MARVQKRRVELFELLANQQASAGAPPASPAAETPRGLDPVLPRAQQAGLREVVFSLDTAFVLFVGVLMLVACAYYLGRKKGLSEQAVGPKDNAPLEFRAEVDIVEGVEGQRLPAVEVTGQEYTLKLRSTKDHGRHEQERLQEDAKWVRAVLARTFALEERPVVLVFDNSQVYSLGVGLFESKEDPRLRALRDLLIRDGGPPTSGTQPYGACVVARTSLLGKVVFP